MRNDVKLFEPLVPFAAVWIGLLWLHSAWVAILLYHALAVTVVLRYRAPVWRHLRQGWSARLAVGLGVWSLLAPVCIILLWPHAMRDDVDLARQLSAWGLDGVSLIVFALYFSFVHPVIEELFWRADNIECRRVFEIRDLAFAGYHALVLAALMSWPWVVVAVAALMLTAAVWRQAIHSAGGLSSVVFAHIVADIGVLVAAFALRG